MDRVQRKREIYLSGVFSTETSSKDPKDKGKSEVGQGQSKNQSIKVPVLQQFNWKYNDLDYSEELRVEYSTWTL